MLTALAGTPLSEINSRLAQHHQCLPFDPLFADAGATLGGTIASGLNGPCSYQRGGIRDSVLGLTYVDGSGEILKLGSRVVKNVAGFDLPKLLAGSLGQLGIMAEITLKVAPLPTATRTLSIRVNDDAELVTRLTAFVRSTTEPEAIDSRPLENRLLVRFGAPAEALDSLTAPILAGPNVEALTSEASQTFWQETTSFAWAHKDGSWLKVPTNLERLPILLKTVRQFPQARLHLSRGGDLAYLSIDSPSCAALREQLTAIHHPSLQFRGTGPIHSSLPSPPAIQIQIHQLLAK